MEIIAIGVMPQVLPILLRKDGSEGTAEMVRLVPNLRVAGGEMLSDSAATVPPALVTDIDEDVGVPDGNWWDSVDPARPTDVRVAFTTPPDLLVGMQQLRAYVRPSGAASPTVRLEAWENGVLKSVGAEIVLTNPLGETITCAFHATVLADLSGAGVEARIVANRVEIPG